MGSYKGLGRKRKALGVSKDDISRVTGITATRISMADRGVIDLSTDELISIRKILKQRERQRKRVMGQKGDKHERTQSTGPSGPTHRLRSFPFFGEGATAWKECSVTDERLQFVTPRLAGEPVSSG